MKCSLGISNFLEEIARLSHSIVFLSLCTDRWGRLSDLSLLLFGTLHSNEDICPLLLCFSFPSLQLFVRPPQTAILLFCISFSWGWSWFLSPVQRQLYVGDNCTVPCTWQLRQFKMVCQTQEWAILFLSKATILGEKTDIKLRTSEKFNVCVCV